MNTSSSLRSFPVGFPALGVLVTSIGHCFFPQSGASRQHSARLQLPRDRHTHYSPPGKEFSSHRGGPAVCLCQIAKSTMQTDRSQPGMFQRPATYGNVCRYVFRRSMHFSEASLFEGEYDISALRLFRNGSRRSIVSYEQPPPAAAEGTGSRSLADENVGSTRPDRLGRWSPRKKEDEEKQPWKGKSYFRHLVLLTAVVY